MKNYIIHDPWKIIETNFNPNVNRVSESLFSIGNGHMGQRANFEEDYSGDSLQGSYIAGVYYPDKTRVGWWKNGYPEYFAKVLNAPNWIGLKIEVNGNNLDLNKTKPEAFCRELNMKKGFLKRYFTVRISDCLLQVESTRFLSMKRKEIGLISYKIKVIEGKANIKITSYIDGKVKNEDSNYNEYFWEQISSNANSDYTSLQCTTKKTNFTAVILASTKIFLTNPDGTKEISCVSSKNSTGFSSNAFDIDLNKNDCAEIIKTAACLTDRDYKTESLLITAEKKLTNAVESGYNKLKAEHEGVWEALWEKSDIIIEGDTAAQQGIRFNIFQLNQTYSGHDERLNIGPKGFTGERYGGASYWDTEAYCLPFYMNTAGKKIAKQLLLYRYKHLSKAIETLKSLAIFLPAVFM